MKSECINGKKAENCESLERWIENKKTQNKKVSFPLTKKAGIQKDYSEVKIRNGIKLKWI